MEVKFECQNWLATLPLTPLSELVEPALYDVLMYVFKTERTAL